MKVNYLFLIAFIFLLSCDPESTLTYKIKNSTSDNLTILFVSSIDESDTLIVNKNYVKVWIVDTDKGSPSKIDLNVLYDSIIISNTDISKIKIYTTDIEGKNIYNYTNWGENKKGKRDYEYIFEITEEDITNNEGK